MEDKMPVPVEQRERTLRQTEGAYPPEAVLGAQHASTSLLTVLLRGWKKALAIFAVVCAVGGPAIWFGIKPKYLAVSAIQVDPVSRAIVFEDASGTMPFYSNYVKTQAELIMSWRVLNPVVEDAEVQKLKLMKKQRDRLGYVKKNLSAAPGASSQLVLVSMLSEDPQAAAVIANAAVRAYMRIAGGTEATSEDEKLRTLERERDTTSGNLRRLYETAYQLGEEFGATDLTAQQQVMLVKVQGLQEQLMNIQAQRQIMEIQVNALKAGQGDISDAMVAKMRNDAIRSDPIASVLTTRVAEMEQDYALASLQMAADSGPLKDKAERLKVGQNALKAAQEKAGREFDEMYRQVKVAEKEQELKKLEAQLEQIKVQEALRNSEMEKQSATVVALGRKGLAIKKLQDEIELTRDLYQRYMQRIQEVQVERQRPARVSVAYEADVPGESPRDKQDRRAKYLVVMALGALLFGCAFVVFQKEMDPRVETPSEVEARCGLRVLGTTPRFRDLDRKRVKAKHFVDDCRTIRVNLMLAAGEKQARTLVVASPQGRDGKTTLAINLATSIALTGKRVLLIDGDLRKPEVARYLKMSNKKGLMSVLAGECGFDEAVQKTILPTLEILPSNRRAYQQGELLGGPVLAQVLSHARMVYDEIIIDTPAILAMPDAKLWATLADGVLLVARSGKTGARDLLEAKARIQQTGARILGAVITGVRIGDSYEKYQHRYGEGYVDEPVSEDDISAARVFLLSRTLGSEELEERKEPADGKKV